MSWDTTSALESDDYLENINLLTRRPFWQLEDELSDELVVSTNHNDPFSETPKALSKHGEIVFINKNAKIRTQNWSEKAYKLASASNLVRSAPQTKHLDAVKNGEVCTLPTIGHGRSDSIMRINADIAAALITSRIKREYVFVDARFRYEYDGGHIIDAINVDDDKKLKELLKSTKIIIFYCEFSSVRGPTLARKLRNADRQLNEYPTLNCPEVYVLEGGYSNFFSQFSELCSPMSYIAMHDKRYTKECAEEYRKKKLRRH